jgi:hypothetical protein
MNLISRMQRITSVVFLIALFFGLSTPHPTVVAVSVVLVVYCVVLGIFMEVRPELANRVFFSED